MKRIISIILTAGALCLAGQTASAQSLKDLFKKVTDNEAVKNVVETVTGQTFEVDVTGTWTYSGMAVKFDSEDLLKSTAATLAAGQVEEKLDEYVAKVGIKSGTFSFTFNEDKSFSVKVLGKSFKGTYSLSEDYKTLSLQFGKNIGIKPFNAAVTATSSQLDLLFQADKLLNLIEKLTATSGNETLKTVGSIASQYDGMKLGLELQK
ncbi:MAG: DUF4923 family protein [Bacteroidales bacterium]|nr:DUF4923 family protein [Bacteroidales bacterium]